MKKQQRPQEQNYLCLNPNCSFPNQRLFRTGNIHFSIQQCSRWITDTSDVRQTLTAFTSKEFDGINMNFVQNPLDSLRNMERFSKSDWKKMLNTQENRIKKDIIASIETEFEISRLKIEELIEKFRDVFKMLDKVRSSPTLEEIALSQLTCQNINFQQVDIGTLFKKSKLKELVKAIKQEVNKIFPTILESCQSHSSKYFLSKEEQKQLHEYIFEATDNYYGKYQTVAASMDKKVSQYSLEREQISLECILCQNRVTSKINPSNKKTVKKILAQKILTHMYCSHFEQTAFAFNRKISPKPFPSVTFQQFIKQSKYFSAVKLIDRESGVKYEQNYSEFKANKNTYVIDILSVKNEHMIKDKYLLVNAHESIDLMIAIITYVCHERDQELQLETNRKNLKNGINQLIDLKIPLDQKKNEQNAIKVKWGL